MYECEEEDVNVYRIIVDVAKHWIPNLGVRLGSAFSSAIY